MTSFRAALVETLRHHLESEDCRYVDNSFRFFMVGDADSMEADKAWLAKWRPPVFADFIRENWGTIEKQIEEKKACYDLLADEASRQTLLTCAAYKLFGHRLVKFAWYRPDTREVIAKLHQQCLCRDLPPEIVTAYAGQEYCTIGSNALYDASSLGLPATLYTNKFFLYALHRAHDYRYASGSAFVDVEEGDVVLDCGACMGDTALLFAHKGGASGRVLSFEPNPYFVVAFKDNMRRNAGLAKNVELIEKAVSDRPDEMLQFIAAGSGSGFSAVRGGTGHAEIEVETTSIDHSAEALALPKVDFIKMDIEGAELAALKGAEQTIRRHRPKLAICVYHKYGDYLDIPQFIHGLGLGYTFYLNKHFMNEWETVLYAKAQ